MYQVVRRVTQLGARDITQDQGRQLLESELADPEYRVGPITSLRLSLGRFLETVERWWIEAALDIDTRIIWIIPAILALIGVAILVTMRLSRRRAWQRDASDIAEDAGTTSGELLATLIALDADDLHQRLSRCYDVWMCLIAAAQAGVPVRAMTLSEAVSSCMGNTPRELSVQMARHLPHYAPQITQCVRVMNDMWYAQRTPVRSDVDDVVRVTHQLYDAAAVLIASDNDLDTRVGAP